jgi:hypothetical protein
MVAGNTFLPCPGHNVWAELPLLGQTGIASSSCASRKIPLVHVPLAGRGRRKTTTCFWVAVAMPHGSASCACHACRTSGRIRAGVARPSTTICAFQWSDLLSTLAPRGLPHRVLYCRRGRRRDRLGVRAVHGAGDLVAQIRMPPLLHSRNKRGVTDALGDPDWFGLREASAIMEGTN